ncbi:MAG: IS66 family transposase [Spirochaetia bacterium]
MAKLKTQIDEQQEYYEKRIDEIQAKAELLEQENKVLRHRLFGRKSEKLTEDDYKQMVLFDEAECAADEDQGERGQEDITVAGHTRKKPGRKPLSEKLPRVEIVHDIAEEEKQCACGAALQRIGAEVCEKLKIIPAKIYVEKHIRPKYACKECEGLANDGEAAVKIAPVPPQIIPRSIVTETLLAFILVSKFNDALPFYRQERMFGRIGAEISRADMANWAIKAAASCGELIELMEQEIREGPVVRIDETRIQVMKEYQREDTSLSYMWVFRGGPPRKPVILYKYHPTRSGEVVLSYLKGYEGFIQTDGYKGYAEVGSLPGIVHVGCWAHVRRKFDEASKAVKKAGSAREALSKISRLYAVERELRELNLADAEFTQKRKQAVEPILAAFKTWLDKRSTQVAPSTLLGKALRYTQGEWPKLINYILSPHLTPDNNLIENAIRPFVVGRKNWLFSGSPKGAHASAALYSIIQTAKANGFEPFKYLSYIFSQIPLCQNKEDFKALLPQHLDANDYKSFSF